MYKLSYSIKQKAYYDPRFITICALNIIIKKKPKHLHGVETVSSKPPSPD